MKLYFILQNFNIHQNRHSEMYHK